MKKKDKDMLYDIFNKQFVLQTKFQNLPFKNNIHRQQFINLNLLACLDELSESMRETYWKNPKYIKCGWKKNQLYNSENFKEELVDLWHFVINLSIASGMSSYELYDRFCKKNKENDRRRRTNY